jgi:hypothetical protein
VIDPTPTPTPAPTPTPKPVSTPKALTTTLTITSANNNQTFDNYRISTTSGPCVTITGATNITISNSNIGPCGQDNSDNDSTGIEMHGGSGINIYDSYIHVENRALTNSFGEKGTHSNIEAGFGGGPGTTNVTIQGNVICYGAANIRNNNGSNNWTVNGNYLCNPRGYDGSGAQVQMSDSPGALIENNYTYSCTIGGTGNVTACPAGYLFSENTDDHIAFWNRTLGSVSVGTVTHNYVFGTNNGDGSGIDSDQRSYNAVITNNTVLEFTNAGIIVNGGTNFVAQNNTAWSNNGSIYLVTFASVDYYPSDPFGPCSFINNTGATHNSGLGDNWSFYNSGPPQGQRNCTLVTGSTVSGNTFGAGVDAILGLSAGMTPGQVMAHIPPPLIPPLPKNCVVKSPYTTQTSLPSCP